MTNYVLALWCGLGWDHPTHVLLEPHSNLDSETPGEKDKYSSPYCSLSIQCFSIVKKFHVCYIRFAVYCVFCMHIIGLPKFHNVIVISNTLFCNTYLIKTIF